MTGDIHEKAIHQMPWFVTAPGGTDVLMVVTGLILAGCVLAFGVLFFRLHALPEHIAHKGQKVQMEIVSVLCLISLFTHQHIFWIAGLVLAFIEMPDFGHTFRRIAGSTEKMAGFKPGEGATEEPFETGAHAAASDQAKSPPLQGHNGPASPPQPAATPASKKELSHA
jgi:hypothetical protein